MISFEKENRIEFLVKVGSIKDDLGRNHPSHKKLDKTEDLLIKIGNDISLLRRKTNDINN